MFWSQHFSLALSSCCFQLLFLGHSKGEKYLISPRQVTSLQHKNVVLCQVAASDAATVVATKAGDIYVLNEYQCRKVASKQLNLTKLVVNGGTLDAELDPNTLQKQGGEELVVVALQKSGRVCINLNCVFIDIDCRQQFKLFVKLSEFFCAMTLFA